MTIHFKYRDGACAVIEHAAAERNGIVMGGINDDLVRKFRAFDFSDDVAGVGFALLLLKRYANGFCAAFNHSLCVVYVNAYHGKNAFFHCQRAKHALVKVIIALFVAEVACHADERERTCLYELFKSVCIDAAGEENDFSLYPAKIDFVKSVNIYKLCFDAVLCGVAGKAVARDFIFLFEGSEHFELCRFDLVMRSLECFNCRLAADCADFVRYHTCRFCFAFGCRKTDKIHLFKKIIHSFCRYIHKKYLLFFDFNATILLPSGANVNIVNVNKK